MSGSKEAEGRGRSVEEAVNEALRTLGARREDVEVTVLEEPSRPLLGLIGGRPARVRVRLLAADAGEGAQAPAAPSGAAAPSPPVGGGNATAATDSTGATAGDETAGDAGAVDGKVAAARSFLVELLGHFEGVAAIDAARDGESLLFSITGEGVSVLIGRHGQTLDAIQYLVNAAVNKGDDDWVRIVVDVDGYRKRREQIVTQMARRVVGEVRRRGMAMKLEPMNAAERRLVHMVVQESSDVQSESEGDEPYRRVIIRPAR